MKVFLLSSLVCLWSQALAFGPPAASVPLQNRVQNHASTRLWAQLIQGDGDREAVRTHRFGWDKDPPKASLDFQSIQKADTAAPWLLNIIEAAHWALVVPTSMGSYALFKYYDAWSQVLDGDSLRLCLWCIVPLLHFVAGIPFMVQHAYEDWQITPISPPGEPLPDLTVYSNRRLREVSYTLFNTLLSVSFLVAFHAYQGWSSPWQQASLIVSAVLLVDACWGDRNNKMSKYIDPQFPIKTTDNGQPIDLSIMPVSVSVFTLLLYSQMMNILYVYFPMASQVEGHWAVKFLLCQFPLVAMTSGMIEGILAESRFDQRYHLLAAVGFNVAAVGHTWALFQLGEYLS